MADNAPAASGIAGLDMEALSRTIDETINKALGARLSRGSLDKMIGEKITAALGGDSIGKAVEAAIAKMVEEAPTETPSTGAAAPTGNHAGKGNGATQQPQDDPRLLEIKQEFQKQLDALRKENAAEKKARLDTEKAAQAAAAQAKQQQLIAHVKAELSKVIGNDAQAGVLAKDLVNDRKWVDVAPDGSIVWNVTKPDAMGGTAVESLPFGDGLKAWSGTDEGKSWVPVRPQQVRMPLAGMPFPVDPSGVHPAAFQRNGAPQPVGNPVLAAMAQDLAGSDAHFASHMMAHAALLPADSKK